MFAKMVNSVVNAHYICVECKRQFIESYEPLGYSEDIERECLLMYVNGSGFRAKIGL